MTITYADLVKIGQELKEQTDQWNRELFSCFEDADYDRGDKIVVGLALAERFTIPDYAKHRITVSQFLPTGSYVVLMGDKKKEPVKWVFQELNLPILKNPKPIINFTGA